MNSATLNVLSVTVDYCTIRDKQCYQLNAIFQCSLYDIILRLHHHDDVIIWKHFPGYWSFVRGIHRWPVNSPHKGQWREALMFSFICAWTNRWVNNGDAGDLRRHRAHYGVTVMMKSLWHGNTFSITHCWTFVRGIRDHSSNTNVYAWQENDKSIRQGHKCQMWHGRISHPVTESGILFLQKELSMFVSNWNKFPKNVLLYFIICRIQVGLELYFKAASETWFSVFILGQF